MSFRTLFVALTFCLLGLFFSDVAVAGGPGDETLKAGFAKADITPDVAVELYGYAVRKKLSEGIHDPLSVRVSAFENNGKKFVLVSSDLGAYGTAVASVFRKSIMDKYDLKDSELFLSTIHSHSSPRLTVDPSTGNPNNIEYTKKVQQVLLDAIGKALKDMKPVLTGVGKGSSPVGSNRREMDANGEIIIGRNPYGPADKEVLVMKVTRLDNTPVAAVFDYATHSTSLGPGNLQVSGDVLGLASQFVEKILGKDVIAPVFAGASANIDPWYRVLPGFNTEPGWIPEPVLLGTLLGEEVVHVFRCINDTKPGGTINTAFEILECPRKNKAANADTNSGTETVPVRITVARIGDDVAFVGFSVEMLTEIGMEIKSASPFKNTFIITHCNGASGYLPPSELYKEGGYEVSSSQFAIGSSDMVVKKTLRMLYDLK